jgi:hypothetical protein
MEWREECQHTIWQAQRIKKVFTFTNIKKYTFINIFNDS